MFTPDGGIYGLRFDVLKCTDIRLMNSPFMILLRMNLWIRSTKLQTLPCRKPLWIRSTKLHTTMVVSEILLTLSNGASCMQQEASRTVKTEIAGVNNGIGNNDKASFSESAGGATVGNDKCEVQEKKNGGQYAMVVSGPSAIGEFNNGTGTASAKRGAKRTPNRKQKLSGRKQINGKRVAQLFASKKVQDELIQCEEERNEATMKLDSVYDEIRPAIEEREPR